jgi:hypothetical protein
MWPGAEMLKQTMWPSEFSVIAWTTQVTATCARAILHVQFAVSFGHNYPSCRLIIYTNDKFCGIAWGSLINVTCSYVVGSWNASQQIDRGWRNRFGTLFFYCDPKIWRSFEECKTRRGKWTVASLAVVHQPSCRIEANRFRGSKPEMYLVRCTDWHVHLQTVWSGSGFYWTMRKFSLCFRLCLASQSSMPSGTSRMGEDTPSDRAWLSTTKSHALYVHFHWWLTVC